MQSPAVYMNEYSLKCAKNPEAKYSDTAFTPSMVKHPSVGVAVTFASSAV